MNYKQEENWRKDSKNWKFGVFYYNKGDNRVFVAKRNPKYGTTLNFAHKKSYFAIAVMALFFGFIIYAIMNFGK
jgi:uncharacterized membrane protein